MMLQEIGLQVLWLVMLEDLDRRVVHGVEKRLLRAMMRLAHLWGTLPVL